MSNVVTQDSRINMELSGLNSCPSCPTYAGSQRGNEATVRRVALFTGQEPQFLGAVTDTFA
jgi:hypothetical protein